MADYWKSTPKYWCKHCSTYVRDTKLERANHEATGKHKGAVERALRDLHRTHEREEREKERAKREIDRLNGVKPSFTNKNDAPAARRPDEAKNATEAQRREQLEQLAGLGVAIPGEMRPDVALAGEWTVTSTRVVEEPGSGDVKSENVDALAVGVRKRERDGTEEKKEEEEAVRGLFKRPKRWGRDARLGGEQDDELDALLSEGFAKKEEEVAKKEEDAEETPRVKVEEGEGGNVEAPAGEEKTEVKREHEEKSLALGVEDAVPSEAPTVMFKKRKPKSMRTR